MAAGIILGVDPGSVKAGYAVVDEQGTVLAAGITPVGELVGCLAQLAAKHGVGALAVGGGTSARRVSLALRELGLPLYEVDEFETTRRARELYFAEHPPSGWRRLVPLGLQVPPRAVDDYAAILIARRFLAEGGEAKTSKVKPPS
jgi:RNase H-fold protein (predicted Holliday junction resolvase)